MYESDKDGANSLGAIFLKPEAVDMAQEVLAGLQFLEDKSDFNEKRIIEVVRKAVNTLVNYETNSTDSLYAEEGYLSESLFDVLYPKTTPGLTLEIIHKMKAKWIGGQYKLVIFEVEDAIDETELYVTLQNIKGKMSEDSPEKAWGLRGYLLRAYLGRLALTSPEILKDENYWLHTGNFIHVPDSTRATEELLNYLNSDSRSDCYNLIHKKNISDDV